AWLTEFCLNQADNVFQTWRQFGDQLVARYADGGLNYPGKLNIKTGYPREWLATTSWPHGPTKYARPEK
ncbi:MAG: dipeptidase, partial [Lentisphaerae bacterium]|nr:dipeptidase [Lentisphaerota bacterium]